MTKTSRTIISLLKIVILILVCLFLAVWLVGFVSEEKIKEEDKHTKICEQLGLELLSVSKEYLAKDYVVCYDKLNDELREVPI